MTNVMANTDLLGNSFNTLVPTHDRWMVFLSVIAYTNDIGIVWYMGNMLRPMTGLTQYSQDMYFHV